jgi:hypothetical protein
MPPSKISKGTPPPPPSSARPPIPAAWSPFKDANFVEPPKATRKEEETLVVPTKTTSNSTPKKTSITSAPPSLSASYIMETPVDDFVGQLPSLELTKQKTNHLAVLEEYLDEFVSDSPAVAGPFVCHVHIKADIDAWRVVCFTETTTVRQALQHITQILNGLLNGKRNWDKYMLLLPSNGGGEVTASSTDQHKLLCKDYGLKAFVCHNIT